MIRRFADLYIRQTVADHHYEIAIISLSGIHKLNLHLSSPDFLRLSVKCCCTAASQATGLGI